MNLPTPKFDTEIFPNRLTRDLVQNAYELAYYGIKFSSERSHGAGRIKLEILPPGDGSFYGDGKILKRVTVELENFSRFKRFSEQNRVITRPTRLERNLSRFCASLSRAVQG